MKIVRWLLLLCFIVHSLAYFVSTKTARWRAFSVKKRLSQQYSSCHQYARTHAGAYPDGNSSNAAFRKLFQEGIEDDERGYFIPPLTKGHNFPDLQIGDKGNGFAQALESGECSLYYIRVPAHPRNALLERRVGEILTPLTYGDSETNRILFLPASSNDNLSDFGGKAGARPLIFAKVGGYDGLVYIVHVCLDGYTQWNVMLDGKVEKMIDGKIVDIWSHEYLQEKYDINPEDILAPEGPTPYPWEIPGNTSAILKWIALISLALFILTFFVKKRALPSALAH